MLDDVAAPLISDVKDTKKTKKGDGKDDKPPADEKSNRRPRAGKNDCKFCILDLCQSETWSKGKDAKKHCLVCSFCDRTKTIPHYPANGSPGAPTKTELMALTVCQAAMRLDPKIDLRKRTIGYCRKLTSDKDDTKKPGEVAAPFVSLEALEMLMDKHGKEVRKSPTRRISSRGHRALASTSRTRYSAQSGRRSKSLWRKSKLHSHLRTGGYQIAPCLQPKLRRHRRANRSSPSKRQTCGRCRSSSTKRK